MTYWLALAGGLALLPSATRVRAEQPEMICITVLHIWTGTLAETRAISSTPVPDSYRRLFGEGPCNTLHKPSLIDWHLAFGTEASVTAALAFLETETTRGLPPPAAFLAGAERAYRRAQPQLAALARLRETPGNHAHDLARVDADLAVQTLRPFARMWQGSILVAQQYLRAAEFHRSAALLVRAQPYLRVASEGVRLFFDDALVGEGRAPPGAAALNLFGKDVNDVRDMEARAAVLKAALSGAAADLAEAERALGRGDTGLLQRAADEAYGQGDDLCEVGDRTDLNDIRTACEHENDFEGRLIAYQRVRAELDMLEQAARPEPSPAFDRVEKLLRHHLLEPGQGWSVRFGAYSDLLASLYLRRGEHLARLVDPADRMQALYALRDAERLTSPADYPARFGQIADRYAVTWQALEGLLDPDWRPSGSPSLAREAAFLKITRAALPRFATGAP